MVIHSSEELISANHELLSFSLKHDRGFTGSKRGAALNGVRFSPEHYSLAGAKTSQLFVVLLRIDPFHGMVS